MIWVNDHKKRLFDFYIPALLCIVSFTWKYAFINLRDIALDEPFTIFHAQQSVSEIWNLSLNGEPNPPLYTLLLHFWIKLFGIESSAVRMLPLLFNTATIVFIYKSAQKISGNSAAILSTLLFFFSSAYFYFALETRTYALVSLGAAAVLYFYEWVRENPKRKRGFVLLLIANLTLVYAHYFSWFILFNEFVFALVFYKNKTFLKHIFFNLLIVFVAYLPITVAVIKQFQKSSQGTWVPLPYKGQILNECSLWLNGIRLFNVFEVLFCVGVILLIVLAIRHKYKPKRHQLTALAVLAGWFAIPFFTMYFVSFKIPMFVDRYILFNAIPFFLFIGVFVETAYGFNTWLKWLIVAVIVGVSAISLQIGAKDFYYREVKAAVKQATLEQEVNGITIIFPAWSDLEFMYHYNRDNFSKVENKDYSLKAAKIFPVWNSAMFAEILAHENPSSVVLYEDGVEGSVESNKMHHILDSAFTKMDSTFFPQTIFVTKFKRPQK